MGADALLLAVEHGLNGVVDAAQVRGLDLDHVARLAVGKDLDVLDEGYMIVYNEMNRILALRNAKKQRA